ncbi:hypothetical protein LVJ59_17615 [Microbacterium sp. KKR3/1]|uniref:hypothetical protein n=1 Tax=Microbacterium sp. KKR3/1 TaxID=2904241 RepID=UPI001E2CA185|nr:hypothetical protein [Microbacterium sp. KKR3/1]MCE0510868.1 hypothetical protein [Microbacterium sp. KKR3/1]
MNADIITDTTYPHGTVKGFEGGCTTGHCPAEVSCRTVFTRYKGDYAFNRQIKAGMTPAEIVAAEEAQAREALEASLAAQKAEKEAKSARTREAARVRHNAARRGRRERARSTIRKGDGIPRTTLQVEIHRLHGEGLTDSQIAEHMGKTRNQIKGVRHDLKLTPNPAPATTGASS